MTIGYSDYLQQSIGNVLSPWQNVWVGLVSNNTSTAYKADGLTDSKGKFTFTTKPPGDTYTVYTSPTGAGLPPGGNWSLFGDANYAIPVVQGENISMQSYTGQISGPYSSTAAPGTIATSSQPDGVVATDLAAVGQWSKADTRTTKLPLIPANSTFLTRFQTGHGWIKSGTGTADLNNTEIVLLGSQDVKMTSNSGTIISINSPNSLNIDLTNRALWVLVYLDDLNANSIGVYLANDNAITTYYKLNVGLPSRMLSGWQVIEFPWDTAVTAGSPTKTGINKIEFFVAATAGTVAVARIGAVGHRLVNQYPNGVMSFTFDHAYVSQYTLARPKLDQYGYPATVYVITGNVDDVAHNYMTTAQLQELEHVHGWEVSAHCTSSAMHVDDKTLTAAQLDAEYSALRSWLLSRGFKGADQFATPDGTINEAVSEAALVYFRSIRTAADTGSAFHQMYAPTQYRALQAAGYDSSVMTVAQIQARMDLLKANGYWGIFVFHVLDPSPPDTSTISPTDFATIVDYANSIGIAVRTVSDVLNLL